MRLQEWNVRPLSHETTGVERKASQHETTEGVERKASQHETTEGVERKASQP